MITNENLNCSSIKAQMSNLTITEKVELAFKSVELVVHFDETGYAQECIDTAKALLENPCKDNYDACYAAVNYFDASDAADADASAVAAIYAAEAAMYAFEAAPAAEDAAASYAYEAARAAAAAGGQEVKDKIIEMLNEVNK